MIWMILVNAKDKAVLYRTALQATLNGSTPAEALETNLQQAPRASPLSQQKYVDVKTYLSDEFLTKVDRMRMAE